MNDDDITNDRRYPSEHGTDPQRDAHPTVEQLSQFLDGDVELDPTDHQFITGHLAHCQDCAEALADLQMMVHALETLPEREAPRSFALTPDMVRPATRPAEPVVLQESVQWHARHAAKVRWATAVAAVLFVFAVSADLVSNTLPLNRDDMSDNDDIVAVQPASDAGEESISALAQDEPEPVPTAAIAEDAYAGDDEAPPALESDEPASADVPDSDDAAGDEAVEDAAVLRSAEDDSGGEGEAEMFSVEEEAISDEPASDLTSSSTDNSQARWRIAQVSLALILALLLAVMIGLPKQRGPRRP